MNNLPRSPLEKVVDFLDVSIENIVPAFVFGGIFVTLIMQIVLMSMDDRDEI
jgi:hypothetical protein